MIRDEWSTSSFSYENNCVEVKMALACTDVVVRHSKKPNGHRLRFTRDEWEAFIKGVKASEFDLPPVPGMIYERTDWRDHEEVEGGSDGQPDGNERVESGE